MKVEQLALSSTVPLPGSTTVRKLSDRGAMGVRRKASVSGCDIGPPADREYAVDPVGVDSNSPSACTISPARLLALSCQSTHDGLGEVLSVKIGVNNGQMWIAPSVKGHFVHDLPTGITDCLVSPCSSHVS